MASTIRIESPSSGATFVIPAMNPLSVTAEDPRQRWGTGIRQPLSLDPGSAHGVDLAVDESP